MTDQIITSRANPLIQELRGLAQRKNRARRGEFFVEGIQPVLQALSSRAPLRMLVVADDLLTSKIARDAVRTQERAGTRIVHVSSQVFETLAEREHPTGLAAVVQVTTQTLADLHPDQNALFAALYQVSNPGNLGTILRTADAVQARGVILIGDVTDPYAPSAIAASRGALFSVPLVHIAGVDELFDWSRQYKLRVVMTSDRAEQLMWNADLRTPLLLIFGNEGEGLPPEILAQGQAVKIPMAGAVDSLNLAVAAGVLLYESARQRR